MKNVIVNSPEENHGWIRQVVFAMFVFALWSLIALLAVVLGAPTDVVWTVWLMGVAVWLVGFVANAIFHGSEVAGPVLVSLGGYRPWRWKTALVVRRWVPNACYFVALSFGAYVAVGRIMAFSGAANFGNANPMERGAPMVLGSLLIGFLWAVGLSAVMLYGAYKMLHRRWDVPPKAVAEELVAACDEHSDVAGAAEVGRAVSNWVSVNGTLSVADADYVFSYVEKLREGRIDAQRDAIIASLASKSNGADKSA